MSINFYSRNQCRRYKNVIIHVMLTGLPKFICSVPFERLKAAYDMPAFKKIFYSEFGVRRNGLGDLASFSYCSEAGATDSCVIFFAAGEETPISSPADRKIRVREEHSVVPIIKQV